ncbi:hypothetical protein FB45DRAFT_482994 [Roridomyces roridus]|uniref:Uncharacterized protein n=1 Tax=Roridomyces roridus TaxID=1738132 RepID=A0AAD7FSD9_9AGAR|nr:hypothetical protein FB45DRAFT_482994 [Roridomyces roridus]
MYVPFITELHETLVRRKGGGASSGGKGGGSSSSAGKGSSSSSGKGSSSSGSSRSGSSSSGSSRSGSSSSSSRPGGSTKSVPIAGSSQKVTGYTFGGGKVSNIPSGQPFAGRSQGGGNRNQIWGSRTYGSGYPGYSGRGVSNLGFPFYFWPLVWGTTIGYGASGYLDESHEYGNPDNTTRPGGPQITAAWQSNSTTPPTTLRVISDNTTVLSLMAAVSSNCSAYLLPSSITTDANASTVALQFNISNNKPEETVQYYRASSVALTLDGYNNSAVFAADNTTADTPLPDGIDAKMLDCVNQTIGMAVPLVGAASKRHDLDNWALLTLFVFFFILFARGR